MSFFVVLDNYSVDFQEVETYVKQTHNKRTSGRLKVVNVFEVARHGEEQRFAAFKNLHNRQLLWHGSYLTNFVGILSNGLKIAPPEAPSSGSNFGKGLYFADAIAKSVGYCSFSDGTALLLLCEVALGNSMNVTTPTNITHLPNGTHSVQATGRWSMSGFKARSDGLLIPYGKLIQNKQLPLQFNEFIVYNEAQVRIKYLVMVKNEQSD